MHFSDRLILAPKTILTIAGLLQSDNFVLEAQHLQLTILLPYWPFVYSDTVDTCGSEEPTISYTETDDVTILNRKLHN